MVQQAPIIDPGRTASFFDLDGTLARIVDKPDAVVVSPEMRGVLSRLASASAGALAVVSGRAMGDVDRILAPLHFPVAGLHGAEWREFDGKTGQLPMDRAPIEAISQSLGDLRRDHPGILIEDKGLAISVHYRLAPDCEQLVVATMDRLIAPYTDRLALQPGKMVLEAKPIGASKGEALERFMRSAPFLGRQPVFAGDDRTDESGFETINAMGGLSIKIGEGATSARFRLSSPEGLARWLLSNLE